MKEMLKGLKEQQKEYERNFINEIKSFSGVILWGLSESTEQAIKYFNKNNVNIMGIFDNDKSKDGALYHDIKIIYPTDQLISDTNIALVITCSYYETIRNNILKLDSEIDQRLFMFDGYFLEDNANYYDDENILNIIEDNYNALEDDKSKKLYIELLKYRYIRDINLINDLYDSRNYCYLDNVFLDNYNAGLYIDAGSYNADFVTTLSERLDVSESKFYIFEPNKIFSNNIIKNLTGKYNFKVYQMALCDKVGEMEFQQIASSTSHLVDKKYNAYNDTLDCNVELVEINTLDNVIRDEVVTGIKIDIEGSENSMLYGATNIIKRDKPILMISVYHRWKDLWELQEYIRKLNLGYKFYLRHYSLSVAKSILYCIPDDQLIDLNIDKGPLIKKVSNDLVINITGESGAGKSYYTSKYKNDDNYIVIDTDVEYKNKGDLINDFDSCYIDILNKYKTQNKTLVIDSAQFRNIKDISLLQGEVIVMRTSINTCYKRCIDRYIANHPNLTEQELESYKLRKKGMYEWYHKLNDFIKRLEGIYND